MPAFLFLAHCARLKNQCARWGQNAPLSRKITTSGRTARGRAPPPRAREGKALPGPHPSWTPVIRSNPLADGSSSTGRGGRPWWPP